MSSRRSLQQRAVARMGARRRAAAPAAARVLARTRAQFRNAPSLRAARMRVVPAIGRENKFFDPVTADGTKQIDCASNAAVANSAGGYVLDTAAAPGAIVLNQIPQGTTQSSRLGRRARITGLRIKGYFLIDSASSTSNNWIQLNVIHQMTPNNPSSMPTYNTIWVGQNTGSLRAVNDADKLKIVRSIETLLIGDRDAPTTGKEAQQVDEFIDLKPFNVITEWTQADTTGVYGNMEKGALLLYAVGSSTNDNNFYGSFRVYFEDY